MLFIRLKAIMNQRECPLAGNWDSISPWKIFIYIWLWHAEKQQHFFYSMNKHFILSSRFIIDCSAIMKTWSKLYRIIRYSVFVYTQLPHIRIWVIYRCFHDIWKYMYNISNQICCRKLDLHWIWNCNNTMSRAKQNDRFNQMIRSSFIYFVILVFSEFHHHDGLAKDFLNWSIS